jgi:hypothetical protein
MSRHAKSITAPTNVNDPFYPSFSCEEGSLPASNSSSSNHPIARARDSERGERRGASLSSSSSSSNHTVVSQDSVKSNSGVWGTERREKRRRDASNESAHAGECDGGVGMKGGDSGRDSTKVRSSTKGGESDRHKARRLDVEGGRLRTEILSPKAKSQLLSASETSSSFVGFDKSKLTSASNSSNKASSKVRNSDVPLSRNKKYNRTATRDEKSDIEKKTQMKNGDSTRAGIVWYCIVQFSMVSYGTVWYGMV